MDRTGRETDQRWILAGRQVFPLDRWEMASALLRESSLNSNFIHVLVSSIFRVDFTNKRIIHTCRPPFLSLSPGEAAGETKNN